MMLVLPLTSICTKVFMNAPLHIFTFVNHFSDTGLTAQRRRVGRGEHAGANNEETAHMGSEPSSGMLKKY